MDVKKTRIQKHNPKHSRDYQARQGEKGLCRVTVEVPKGKVDYIKRIAESARKSHLRAMEKKT